MKIKNRKPNFGVLDLDKIRELEKEHKEKYGYYIHYVVGFDNGLIDAHTHGLCDYNNHLELQIVISISYEIVNNLINNLGQKIKNGIVFQDGDKLSDLIKDYDIVLKEAKDENGNSILRMIFPDNKGKFPWDDGCNAYFALQYKK